MNNPSIAYGKWILVGEHSVLRGQPALVFPAYSFSTTLTFTPAENLTIVVDGINAAEIRFFFSGIIEEASKILSKKIVGDFKLQNKVPLGCGLGASASLSAVIARELVKWSYLGQDQLFKFAWDLENIFHGESSGVDVAVAVYQSPIKYIRGSQPTEWLTDFQPHLYLSFCGEQGLTKLAVERVKNLPIELRKSGDDLMLNAYNLAIEAFAEKATDKLSASIHSAANAFNTWTLLTPAMEKEINRLKKLGALSAKPTGSGMGGYVLSLFASELSQEYLNQNNLVSCFKKKILDTTIIQ